MGLPEIAAIKAQLIEVNHLCAGSRFSFYAGVQFVSVGNPVIVTDILFALYSAQAWTMQEIQ
jgi:hypothetical protein